MTYMTKARITDVIRTKCWEQEQKLRAWSVKPMSGSMEILCGGLLGLLLTGAVVLAALMGA